MYEPRTYRQTITGTGLVPFTAVVQETDLFILAERDLCLETVDIIRELRIPLEAYIRSHPLFMHSLEPVDIACDAPEIVRCMANAARLADVGPMAAVAGTIAELVGKRLLNYSPEIIVENGGDIFIQTRSRRLIGIYAGQSELSGRLAIEIDDGQTPLGICTSSGRVGHSLSLGLADAAIVIAPSTPLADAAATAVCNRVRSAEDIDRALEYGRSIPGVHGLIIIVEDRLGIWGDIKLVDVS